MLFIKVFGEWWVVFQLDCKDTGQAAIAVGLFILYGRTLWVSGPGWRPDGLTRFSLYRYIVWVHIQHSFGGLSFHMHAPLTRLLAS